MEKGKNGIRNVDALWQPRNPGKVHWLTGRDGRICAPFVADFRQRLRRTAELPTTNFASFAASRFPVFLPLVQPRFDPDVAVPRPAGVSGRAPPSQFSLAFQGAVC